MTGTGCGRFHVRRGLGGAGLFCETKPIRRVAKHSEWRISDLGLRIRTEEATELGWAQNAGRMRQTKPIWCVSGLEMRIWVEEQSQLGQAGGGRLEAGGNRHECRKWFETRGTGHVRRIVSNKANLASDGSASGESKRQGGGRTVQWRLVCLWRPGLVRSW